MHQHFLWLARLDGGGIEITDAAGDVYKRQTVNRDRLKLSSLRSRSTALVVRVPRSMAKI